MNRNQISDKRLLLSNFFEGKTHSLRTYKASPKRIESPYQLVIQDEMAGTVYAVGKDGSQYTLAMNELAKVPPSIFIQIIDHSGGQRVPEPDEDYYDTTGL